MLSVKSCFFGVLWYNYIIEGGKNMIDTLRKNSQPEFSFTRCCCVLMKFAILGAMLYAGKATYDSLTKDTDNFAKNIGAERINRISNSLGR